MATKTTTTDAEQSDGAVRDIVIDAAKGAGVSALLGSLFIHYALAAVLLNETLGPVFETQPEWFLITVNTALGIPIVVGMVAYANWLICLYTGGDTDWGALAIYAAAAAVVALPVFIKLGAL